MRSHAQAHTHLNVQLSSKLKTRLSSKLTLMMCGVIYALSLGGCRSETDPKRQAHESAARPSGEGARKIAKVGDRLITEADVLRRLNDLSPVSRARYQTPDRRQELIESLIRFTLLATEAEKRGYGEDPEVRLAHEQAMVRKLLSSEVRHLVKLSDIKEAEIEAYYREHHDDYERPELVRASHILFKSEAEARAALSELRLKIKAKPQEARQLFGDLAAERSGDQETRARRGDLQYFTRSGEGHGARRFPQSAVPTSIAEAAFAIERVGELNVAPVQSKRGWHLIQRTGGKRAFKRPLDEVKGEIRKTLFRLRKSEALESYVANLKSRVKVEVDEARLNAIEIPARRPRPGPRAPMPGLPSLVSPNVDAASQAPRRVTPR